jgi:hypothetical protein
MATGSSGARRLSRGEKAHLSTSDGSGAWLFVPIAGPFVARTRPDVQKDGRAMFWFTAFGTTQVVGAGVLPYYFAAPSYHLEKTELGRLTLPPVVDRHHQGLWVSQRF